MSPTLTGVEQLRQLVDEARGSESLASVARRLGESEQWLSNKLRGARKIDPAEVVRLAVTLNADPVQWTMARWPELAEHDRLVRLRSATAGATADEMRLIEEYALEVASPVPLVTSRPAGDAAPRSSTAGSRPGRRAGAAPHGPSRSSTRRAPKG